MDIVFSAIKASQLFGSWAWMLRNPNVNRLALAHAVYKAMISDYCFGGKGQFMTVFMFLKSHAFIPHHHSHQQLSLNISSVLLPHKEVTFGAASVYRRYPESLAGTTKTQQHCQHSDSLCLPGHSSTCFASFSRSRHPPLLTNLGMSCLVCKYVWHCFCCLSSLSCPFLSHSLASLCSQRVAVADTAVAVSWFIVRSSDKFKFVMLGVMGWCFHGILGLVTGNSQWLSLLFRVMLWCRVTSGGCGSDMLPYFFIFILLFCPIWLLVTLLLSKFLPLFMLHYCVLCIYNVCFWWQTCDLALSQTVLSLLWLFLLLFS